MKIVMVLTLLFSFVFAEYKVGDVMKAFEVADQFEKKMQIDEKLKIMVLATSKDSGKVGHSFFENKPKEFFEKNGIVYVSDMSSVPGFVLDFFMMGKFKKYGYQIALLKDEKIAELLPEKEDMLSVIWLENLKIKEVQYAKTKEDLEKLLAL